MCQYQGIIFDTAVAGSHWEFFTVNLSKMGKQPHICRQLTSLTTWPHFTLLLFFSLFQLHLNQSAPPIPSFIFTSRHLSFAILYFCISLFVSLHLTLSSLFTSLFFHFFTLSHTLAFFFLYLTLPCFIYLHFTYQHFTSLCFITFDFTSLHQAVVETVALSQDWCSCSHSVRSLYFFFLTLHSALSPLKPGVSSSNYHQIPPIILVIFLLLNKTS